MNHAEHYFNDAEIKIVKPTDHRSYNVSSQKAFNILGFKPKYHITDAIHTLVEKLKLGIYQSPMENIIYYNKYKPGYSV